MNPLLALECQRAVPNRFDLVHLTAGRAKALGRGETAKVTAGRTRVETALHEVAENALAGAELARYWPAEAWLQPPAELKQQLLPSGGESAQIASAAATEQTHNTN